MAGTCLLMDLCVACLYAHGHNPQCAILSVYFSTAHIDVLIYPAFILTRIKHNMCAVACLNVIVTGAFNENICTS